MNNTLSIEPMLNFNFDELKTATVVQIYIKSKELDLDLDIDEINELSELAFEEWFNLSLNENCSEYAYVSEYIEKSFNLLLHLNHLKFSNK